MKKFKNINVLKSKKRCFIPLFIGILFLLLSFVFFMLSEKQNHEDNKNIKYLNDIIEKNETEGQKAYVNIEALSPKFAVYDDTTDAYYFAFDGNYYYVIYMKEDKAKELENQDLSQKKVKLEGIVRNTTSDIKKIAIDQYNTLLEGDQEKLTLSDFDRYFGKVYLDQTATYSETTGMYNAFTFICIVVAFILLLTSFIKITSFSKEMKKLSTAEVDILESEMEDKEAFYYNKINLYLTQNYIIMLDGKFKVYPYSDILWMYPFEQKYNGIRTNKAIKILTKDAKTTIFANISVVTKAKNEIYNEIWNTIISKNPNINTGYTQDNIKYFREVTKEIKKKKSNM